MLNGIALRLEQEVSSGVTMKEEKVDLEMKGKRRYLKIFDEPA
jgi:hypothetical protein